MYNPYVGDEALGRFLARYGEVFPGVRYVRDGYGIWTGKRQFRVRLKKDPQGFYGLLHPPAFFSLGADRGILFYSGQPVYCRKCRAFGHLADVCKEEVRCRNCNEVGHAAQACPNPKKCHACGCADHLFRECPGTVRTYAEAAAGRPGPSASQEPTEEGQGPEQMEQTVVEVGTSEPLVAPAQQAGGPEEEGVESMVECMKKEVAGLGKGRREWGGDSKIRQARRRKVVEGLRGEDGTVKSGPEEMVEVATCFYKELFGRRDIDYGEGEGFLKVISGRIPEDVRERLEGVISLGELDSALRGLRPNKVTGVEGLPVEFYRVFWDRVGPDLLKVLTNRLKTALPHIVHEDQTCGVVGRQMYWSLQFVRDAISWARDRELPLMLVGLDQEKAFDQVSHKFLFRVLHKFGFGPQFIRIKVRSFCSVCMISAGPEAVIFFGVHVLTDE
ncbi:hypothetical protein SKAU_G00387170 [Synaphobranchus kaupii]|uniref:CCHC-type domain-containing protein n=1 Tax=Synaphobranchus kaupii TaxID=118154 RepID=A0A9Q1EAW0_SYNKA|nr:hypothetical protein SKAU_G00387170 [Synaphobranchus kaupii]